MPPSSPFLSSLAAYSPSSLPICKLYDPNLLGLSLECCLSKDDPKAFIDFETGQLIYSTFKITTDGDCSHEIKRCLLLGRKLWSTCILKSRDITLPTKVCLVKVMVFPVVMYGYESWTIKLSAEELMLLNCDVGEDSWESLGLQGDPTSPS